jgi:hypothetical protein
VYTNQFVVRCDTKLCIFQGYKQLHELYPPSDIIKDIKEEDGVGVVLGTLGEHRNEYRILVRKPMR